MTTSRTIQSAERERAADRLKVQTFPDRAEMGEAAAEAIASAMRDGLARQASLRMVFASAPSQAATLDRLAAAPGIDWSRVTAFHMDEYIGLPDTAPERFGNWLEANLFSRVPMGSAHLMQPGAEPDQEAVRYAALLSQAPIDIVCLGIGTNGHIAFNDPPVADFADPLDVKTVELDLDCRQQQVDDACFARLEDVPTHAITLTVPRLLRAGQMFCMVPGRAKRDAVAKTLYGPVSTNCPASILRTHPACTLFLDRESDPDA